MMKLKIGQILFHVEDVIYGIVSLLLIGTVLLVIYSIVLAFLHVLAGGDLITNIIHIIDQILLTLMIIEILYTVIVSFESHSLKCEPFLIVGLIASVRRILLIGLQAAHIPTTQSDLFYKYMVELGLMTLLVFVFVISMYIMRKRPKQTA